MKKAVVIGSGAGGSTVAKELQGSFDVTIIEAGGKFKPFPHELPLFETLSNAGVFFDEQLIQFVFRSMKIRKTGERMVLVNGMGTGGSTTISAGNAIRMDADLKKINVNLDEEFDEINKEIPITTNHEKKWSKTTETLFRIFSEMQLDPFPIPKMGHYDRCARCGRCILGCPYGIKWDSRKFLDNALENGAKLEMHTTVDKIDIKNGSVVGVFAHRGLVKKYYPADLVVLSAGGFGTPVILEASGIPVEKKLFVDPVLCVAAEFTDAKMDTDIPMPFAIQKEHYIISPYFDFLSFLFNKKWHYKARNIASIMIKLSDSNIGDITKGHVNKILTDDDKNNLNEAVLVCREVLGRLGVDESKIFLGTLNAGHPGGMLPLTEKEAENLHNPGLPPNLYIADASLYPDSLGNPPILTIIALAKKVSKLCKIL